MSSSRPKKRCPVCKTGHCKTIKSRYSYADSVPVFCSLRCAAEWGLLSAGAGGECAMQWCSKHGWQRGENFDFTGCDDCALEDETPRWPPGPNDAIQGD